jgi:Fic family protein
LEIWKFAKHCVDIFCLLLTEYKETVPAADTSLFMEKLIYYWNTLIEDRHVHPLIVLTAFNLDFLSIHPFRDGNGRVSRLLLLLGSYHLGFEVGRYISFERLIEDNKDRLPGGGKQIKDKGN